MRTNAALSEAGIPHNGQAVRRVNSKVFRAAISAGKTGSNSWMVDVHSRREYKGMRCYLTQDGKAGFAIKRDGDVVSLFSAAKGSNAMGKLIPTAVALGGKKLDCYAERLQNLYARYGAKAVSKTAFNEEYAPDGWDGRKPPLVAMVLPRSVEEIIRNYDKDRTVNMARVKEYGDYDGMINARDRALKRMERASNASAIRSAFGAKG